MVILTLNGEGVALLGTPHLIGHLTGNGLAVKVTLNSNEVKVTARGALYHLTGLVPPASNT